MSSHIVSLAARGPIPLTAWLLATAGAVPFLAGIIELTFLGGGRVGAVQIYGAVIAAFLCGTHWAAAVLGSQALAIRLFALSNVMALLAWLGALLPARLGFVLLAIVFAALLAVDGVLYRRGLWPHWFWQLRRTVTAVVVIACVILAVAA